MSQTNREHIVARRYERGYYKKERKSWLTNLFEFNGSIERVKKNVSPSLAEPELYILTAKLRKGLFTSSSYHGATMMPFIHFLSIYYDPPYIVAT